MPHTTLDDLQKRIRELEQDNRILSQDITAHKQIEDLLRFQRDLGIYLSTSRDLQQTLTHVLESICGIEGIDAAGIYLIDELTGCMDLAAHKGFSSELAGQISHYEAGSPQVREVMEGTPVYRDCSDTVTHTGDPARRFDFKAMAIIPIRSEDRTIGSLFLVSFSLDAVPINVRIALETITARMGGVIVRIKAEDTLKKYELILSTVHDFISFIDTGYIYRAVNKTYLLAFQKPREEIIGKSVADLFGEEVFRNRIQKQIDSALGGKETHYEERFDYPAWPGRWMSLSYYPYREKDGSISGIAVIARDITERKKAEKRLMESEVQYRHLFEYANDAILIIKDLLIVDCNRKSLETFGCTREDMISRHLAGFLPLLQPDGEKSLDRWARLQQRVLYDKPQIFEWVFQRCAGEVFDAEVGINHIELKGQHYIQAIIRDITQRKRREEEHIKVSKLESIGILAGGIAHDFNNILATILGNIELAQTFVQDRDKPYTRLSRAIEACNRARDLTMHFLALSKGSTPLKKTGAIAPLIRESTGLALSGSNIRCEVTLPDDLWLVEFDESQLLHAFDNILVNAREAMPNGGTITISAENIVHQSGTFIAGAAVPEGPYLRIAITDTGPGIPEDIRTKIFDPYFSTKEMGAQKGMGLGLTTTYSIIKKHGGYLFMDSVLNVGTTFHIMLPAIRKSPAVHAPGEATFSPGEKRILLMDDEEMIRDTVSHMLHELGYDVETSRNGEEAVERYILARKAGLGFDAVILDLTVRGGMGGAHTMEQLKKIDPKATGIISSGYSDDTVMINFEKYGFSAVMVKPFSMAELSDTLQKILTPRIRIGE